MNLIKVPPRLERLEKTRERLTKAFDLAAMRQDKKRGIETDRSEASLKIRDELLNAFVEGLDECGYFVAYVGD